MRCLFFNPSPLQSRGKNAHGQEPEQREPPRGHLEKKSKVPNQPDHLAPAVIFHQALCLRLTSNTTAPPNINNPRVVGSGTTIIWILSMPVFTLPWSVMP